LGLNLGIEKFKIINFRPHLPQDIVIFPYLQRFASNWGIYLIQEKISENIIQNHQQAEATIWIPITGITRRVERIELLLEKAREVIIELSPLKESYRYNQESIIYSLPQEVRQVMYEAKKLKMNLSEALVRNDMEEWVTISKVLECLVV